MLNLEAKTKLAPEAINVKLKSYFGSGGYGLELTNDCDNLLTFEGGGGYVTAHLCIDGEQTRIDLETREWEYAVRKFTESLR